MKTLALLFLPFLTSTIYYAQTCSCKEEFKFVVDYYETNLPGFKDNVSAENKSEYDQFKQNLGLKAEQVCENKQECFKLLNYYVEFFRDNHSSISFNAVLQVNEKDSVSLAAFLKSDLFLSQEAFDPGLYSGKTKPVSSLENTYQFRDLSYTVQVVADKTESRDYVGIILESRTPMWKKGQVKFELKETAKGKFNMLLYARNHTILFFNDVEFKDGILANEWFNVKLKKRKSYNIETPKNLVFTSLNKETNYIYIPTFSGNWIAKLDSFYRKNDSLIRAKPKLIIDVRNNGGGSDDNAKPLLRYIYTKPFYSDSVELFVTPENIRKSVEWYEENKADTINFDAQFMAEILSEINAMKSAPENSFITRTSGELIQLNEVLSQPSKVAILMNRNCASSCESLFFWAKESDKTVLLGENSGGYVGYGEISSVDTPHFKFSLNCTMTRYTKQRAFEVIGVSPDRYLDNKSDWVEQALEILK